MADIDIITADLEIVAASGVQTTLVQTRKLKGKLWEIKTGTRSQQRIFYCLVSKDGIILLHACKKKKQGAQQGDVDLAYKRMKEVL